MVLTKITILDIDSSRTEQSLYKIKNFLEAINYIFKIIYLM